MLNYRKYTQKCNHCGISWSKKNVYMHENSSCRWKNSNMLVFRFQNYKYVTNLCLLVCLTIYWIQNKYSINGKWRYFINLFSGFWIQISHLENPVTNRHIYKCLLFHTPIYICGSPTVYFKILIVLEVDEYSLKNMSYLDRHELTATFGK